MQMLPRFAVKRRGNDVMLIDVVTAVMDIAQNERELTAVIMQMLQSGSIRFRRPLCDAT